MSEEEKPEKCVEKDLGAGSGEIPRAFGDFRIIKEIGKGGMGTVYEAEQLSLQRRVALKVLPSHLTISKDAVLKFRREAEAGGRQHHPGIVAIYSVGEQEGIHYIAQELVGDGVTLGDRLDGLKNNGDQPPGYFREVARLVSETADALRHAHDSGVIHRDIKPSNILLTGEGNPKVSDFGLAKVQDALALSRTGDFAGTPYYMSPEQAMSRRMGIDKRTDIYSLGVTLYEMLTLHRPFEGDTSHEVLKKIMLVDPENPHKANPRVPRDLSVICLKAMEKVPEKRYPSMKELSEDLERFLSGDVILAKPAGLGTRLWKRVKRNPVVSATMGVVLAAAVIFAVVVPWVIAQKEKENAALLTLEKDKAVTARNDAEAEKERALAAEVESDRQRQIAEEQRNVAEDRYQEIIRLADVKELSDLESEAETLWPAHPEKISSLQSWLRRADALGGRLDEHRATLDALRTHALPHDEEASLKDREDRAWNFEDRSTQWRHDTLEGLVSGVDAFLNEERGTLKDIRKRLEFAETVVEKSIEEHQDAWDETIASIADREMCPQYGGLVIEPKIGFVPIGRDPASGLWEFAHLQTGRIPLRDTEGKLFLDEEMGLVFVLIPGGTFNMGAVKPSKNGPIGTPNVDPETNPDEGPVHEVTLKPFFLSKYEMTQGQWHRFTKVNRSNFQPGYGQVTLLHPVEQVDSEECVECLSRLKLRLPSESEWEYACRAGTRTVFWTGDDKETMKGAVNLADFYCKNQGGPGNWPYEEWLDDRHVVHAPVGSFTANAFGLHDVHGNVYEWCQDLFGSYENAPVDGSANTSGSSIRINRGGSWSDAAFACRSAYRNMNDPTDRNRHIGLRPASSCLACDSVH